MGIIFIPKQPWLNVDQMFNEFDKFFIDIIEKLLHAASSDSIKIQFKILIKFTKYSLSEENGEERIVEKVQEEWISIPNIAVTKPDDLINDTVQITFLALIEKYLKNGSGWTIDCILMTEWTIVKYNRITYYHGLGARGKKHNKPKRHKLPADLRIVMKSKGIINVDNKNGDDCFKWAVLSILFYKENIVKRTRMSSYEKWKDELCFDGCKFPMTIPQIKIFENRNTNLAINVYEWIGFNKTSSSGDKLPPLKFLRQCSSKKGINRQIINILKKNDHFYGISNMNRLLNSGLSNRHRKWCERCIRPFHTQAKLDQHRLLCYQAKRQVEIMPLEEKKNLNLKIGKK